MRTLRITLLASLAGWIAGMLAGSIGGLVLALVDFGPRQTFSTLTVQGVIVSEVQWALMTGVAILPGSVFVLAPLVFRVLGRSSSWHPLAAAAAGAGIGIVGLPLWLLVVSFFISPINWSRAGEARQVLTLSGSTAVVTGAIVGFVAAMAVRTPALRAPSTPTVGAMDDVPPPLPYDY